MTEALIVKPEHNVDEFDLTDLPDSIDDEDINTEIIDLCSDQAAHSFELSKVCIRYLNYKTSWEDVISENGETHPSATPGRLRCQIMVSTHGRSFFGGS